MPLFDRPRPFRLRELAAASTRTFQDPRALGAGSQMPLADMASLDSITPDSLCTAAALNLTLAAADVIANAAHDNHPNFLHLASLVCEAVLEVVFVALPGFLVAYTGMFDVKSQKFVAELNTMVFTPCLIFTKLASQLNADKLADLVVIPVIFLAQTAVSYVAAHAMARLFGFGRKKREKSFILAMGVFGNSNSLPISLVLSLSQTISGLHWDKVPGDNDNDVAARGILYLLIFQQLGQLLRWTWGYNVLLKPKAAFDEDERTAAKKRAGIEGVAEEGQYRDASPVDEAAVRGHLKNPITSTDSGFSSGNDISQSVSSASSSSDLVGDARRAEIVPVTPANGNIIENEPANLLSDRPPSSSGTTNSVLGDRAQSLGHITTFPTYSPPNERLETSKGWKTPFIRAYRNAQGLVERIYNRMAIAVRKAFNTLPTPLQKALATIHHYHMSFWRGVWHQMNPPLWAMLAALVVASIPALQQLFFKEGSFVKNTFSSAVKSSGGVAVPLILVVLGANLARSTLPKDQLASTAEEKTEERKLLYASLLARMLLPTIVMTPILAVMAKFVPISILDDPIFIIVCFLLTGAPSALQLAQICQINEVFMGAMSNLLVASYVFAIFPSTLLLVMLALECLEWAA